MAASLSYNDLLTQRTLVNITSTATYVSGPCRLMKIIVFNTAAGTIEIFNNTAASGDSIVVESANSRMTIYDFGIPGIRFDKGIHATAFTGSGGQSIVYVKE